MNTAPLKIIVVVKFKVRSTRSGMPIYYNFPCIVSCFPNDFIELQHLLKRARFIAERKIYRRLKRRVEGNLEFYVVVKSPWKKYRFTLVYPKIVVDCFGNIVKFKAPPKNLTYAYNLYVDYLRTMYARTGDHRFWYKYLGVSIDPYYLERRMEYIRRMGELRGKGVKTMDWNPLASTLDKAFETWVDRVLKTEEPFKVKGLEVWVDEYVHETPSLKGVQYCDVEGGFNIVKKHF